MTHIKSAIFSKAARAADGTFLTTGTRASKEQLADRRIRAMLPHRDLIGKLVGDPPIGLSALDRKKRKHD